MKEVDLFKAGEETLAKVKKEEVQKYNKKAVRVHAFATKVNNMKNDSDVLKEIAKLLFEINENLK